MSVVHLLVNTQAGRGRDQATYEVVCRVINAAGYAVERIKGQTVEASIDAVQATVAGGAERLVVVGGDGTLHIALQAVVGTSTVLGIVPAGTGNDFARTFGLCGITLEQAAARALGPDRRIDVIRANRGRANQGCTWVASNVTGGFSVDVNNRARQMWFPRGSSRYVIATLLTVPMLRHRRVAFIVDGQRSEFTTSLWAVANTPTFGGGMAVCPDANPDDGLLNLSVATDIGTVSLLRLLPKVFKGTHVHHRKVHTLTGRQITVETTDSVNVEDAKTDRSKVMVKGVTVGGVNELDGDGEPVGALPVTLTVERAALRLAADL